ncbi:MAG TPA: hypothetical protein ENI87_11260 [bacterium]|nr:hypothetical protein [bacterium]
MIHKTLVPSLLLAATLSFGGCGTAMPAVPVSAFLAGDLASVHEFAEQQVREGAPENLALVLNVAGQCELYMGDTEKARRSLRRAAGIMGTWATSGDEATAAILGSESSKTYKGDPYEKAMNALLLAYCYLQKGEADNARAALKRGILMDAEVADEEYQADNALLFWMAGRMSRIYGGSGAEEFFAEARTAHEFALAHGSRGDAEASVVADPEHGNLVLLLAVGLGPEKYGDGSERQLARFRPQPHPAVAARAVLDGESLGRASILCDVDYQAMTLGGTAMEGIRKGKAVFRRSARTAGTILLNESLRNRSRDQDKARAQAIVGGSLLLLSALTSAAADTRHWPTLPSTVQVLCADVPPGEHELVVEFLDARGRPLPALRHTMSVAVPDTGETWLLVPSLPQPQPQPRPRP